MNVDMFLWTLPYMLKGMLGIFIVTIVIILSIVVLNKVTGRIRKKEVEEE